MRRLEKMEKSIREGQRSSWGGVGRMARCSAGEGSTEEGKRWEGGVGLQCQPTGLTGLKLGFFGGGRGQLSQRGIESSLLGRIAPPIRSLELRRTYATVRENRVTALAEVVPPDKIVDLGKCMNDLRDLELLDTLRGVKPKSASFLPYFASCASSLSRRRRKRLQGCCSFVQSQTFLSHTNSRSHRLPLPALAHRRRELESHHHLPPTPSSTASSLRNRLVRHRRARPPQQGIQAREPLSRGQSRVALPPDSRARLSSHSKASGACETDDQGRRVGPKFAAKFVAAGARTLAGLEKKCALSRAQMIGLRHFDAGLHVLRLPKPAR